VDRRIVVAALASLLLGAPVVAEAQGVYKPEFKMSLVVSEDTAWGRAAVRFASALRHRTGGRIQVKNYFDGTLFADRQTTEFQLLQQGDADFAIGSTVNWSPQVKELNLFAMPFLFSGYGELDAVEAGDPGTRLFKLLEQRGVVPLAWGENGFRELTNAKRPVRRPEDLQGLNVRVVGVPIFIEMFRVLGANPVSMNWGEALIALQRGRLDGQENPLGLIIPYRIWAYHRHVTLWRYAIDPLILAMNAKTWSGLTPEDQSIVRAVAAEVMGLQKKEAREGLHHDMALPTALEQQYGMAVVRLSPEERQAFRQRVRPVYEKWASEIGVEMVRRAERIVEDSRR
jgi:tripartite ATP-independent transporter DctP family solute receptor